MEMKGYIKKSRKINMSSIGVVVSSSAGLGRKGQGDHNKERNDE